MPEQAHRFAGVLQQQRRRRGWTQAQLAERAQLSERAISDLERGLKAPHRATVRLLAEALALTSAEAQAFEATAQAHRRGLDDGTPGAALGALPHPLTSFVGRAAELAEVRRLLGGTRLLTLIGAGGCGKSRLALHVAHEVGGTYQDGAIWVDLAPLGDPDLVTLAVLVAVGLREVPGRDPLEVLRAHLRARQHLLVLDTCEHLVEACAALAEALLGACPRLSILATSREVLGLAGETTWRVPSLAAPDHAGHAPIEALVEFPAVRLFAERAAAAQPGFRLDAATAPAVGQICARLDGLPLAIELAAARVRVLSPAQIATRLDDCFQVLSGPLRARLPRHRTLRATIDWSYDLLTPAEQVLVRRLAVFAGGWTVEAAEAICAGPEVPPRGGVLEPLAGLADKSLVNVEVARGPARYRMLDTIRQYAAERLAGAGEAAALRQRHGDWYAVWAERATAGLVSTDQVAWRRWLETEQDNLRAALAWSHAEPGAAQTELRLAAALGRFWYVHGHAGEGRARLAAALGRPAAAPSAARVTALTWAARLERDAGAIAAARRLAEQSVAMAVELHDDARLALAARGLALSDFQTEDHGPVIALLEQAIAAARRSGVEREAAMSLSQLAYRTAQAGDPTAARRLFEAGLAAGHRSGDQSPVGCALTGLARLATSQGRQAEAEGLLRRALAISRRLDDLPVVLLALQSQGDLARSRHDLAGARARYVEALVLAHRSAGARRVAELLVNIAAVDAAAGRFERAARLFGAEASWREGAVGQTGDSLCEYDTADQSRALAAARAALDPATFGRAWDAGLAMTLDQAVADVLAEAPGAGQTGAELGQP